MTSPEPHSQFSQERREAERFAVSMMSELAIREDNLSSLISLSTLKQLAWELYKFSQKVLDFPLNEGEIGCFIAKDMYEIVTEEDSPGDFDIKIKSNLSGKELRDSVVVSEEEPTMSVARQSCRFLLRAFAEDADYLYLRMQQGKQVGELQFLHLLGGQSAVVDAFVQWTNELLGGVGRILSLDSTIALMGTKVFENKHVSEEVFEKALILTRELVVNLLFARKSQFYAYDSGLLIKASFQVHKLEERWNSRIEVDQVREGEAVCEGVMSYDFGVVRLPQEVINFFRTIFPQMVDRAMFDYEEEVS